MQWAGEVWLEAKEEEQGKLGTGSGYNTKSYLSCAAAIDDIGGDIGGFEGCFEP